MKSIVYVLTDSEGRILECEGGYSMGNIQDAEQWIQIDEGTGDRFNLCQRHYFPDGVLTEDGIPRYRLEDGKPVLRSVGEIEEERACLPVRVTQEERLRELEEALELILAGVTE